jgi:drug/metabolite transporter (DMT)-like permease
VIFGLGAALGWGFADLGAAISGRRLGALVTLLLAQASGLILLTLIFAGSRSHLGLSLPEISAICINAVAGAGAYFALYRGLELGPLSVVSPIVASYAVFTVPLAVTILHESLSPYAASGVVITVLGAILTSADLRGIRATRMAAIGKGLPWALAATVTFGFSTFAFGWFSRKWGAMPVALTTRIAITAIFALIWLFAGGRRRARSPDPIDRRGVQVALGVGLADAIGIVAFVEGAAHSNLAIVSAVSATFPLISVLGAVTRFKERPAPNQLLGVACVVGGLILLSLVSATGA